MNQSRIFKLTMSRMQARSNCRTREEVFRASNEPAMTAGIEPVSRLVSITLPSAPAPTEVRATHRPRRAPASTVS